MVIEGKGWGQLKPRGIGGVRDAKGATALLCANAMGFTTNKRPYQWRLKEKVGGRGGVRDAKGATALLCADAKVTPGLRMIRETTLLCKQ